jgi:hypothetical protein
LTDNSFRVDGEFIASKKQSYKPLCNVKYRRRQHIGGISQVMNKSGTQVLDYEDFKELQG